MRCAARLAAVAGTVLVLAAPSGAAALPRAEEGHGGATPVPTAMTHDHDAGHQGSVPEPTASGHDQGTGTTGHDDHGAGTSEPDGGHEENGSTVVGTGPDSDTRLLVLSLFAGVNGVVLMAASVQRRRTAGARDRRRAARAAAPPAV